MTFTELKNELSKFAFSASDVTFEPDLSFSMPVLCDRPNLLFIYLKNWPELPESTLCFSRPSSYSLMALLQSFAASL